MDLSSPSDKASLRWTTELQIDEVCARFEECCKKEQRPRLEEYMNRWTGPGRSALERELLKLEIAYRKKAEEHATLHEYLARFPEQAAWLATLPDLARHEERPVEGSSASALQGVNTTPEIPFLRRTEPALSGPPSIPVAGYEILTELGRGGMGVVYKARQLRLNRLVALKMIRAGTAAEERDVARFCREAETVARFRHPHIVQIYEIGESGGQPFFAQEYVPGGTLADRIQERMLVPQQVATLLRTLAETVDAAHQQGIIHRDLKPRNILLTEDGQPKLTDFGLARRLHTSEGLTLSGEVVGTPSYMSPEQAEGKNDEVGPLSDVYGLGAIMYEMLTGRPPFRAPAPLDTLRQVISDDPVPPRQLQSQVPRDLETICLHCLHKQPRRRYASAAALAEDLGRWQEGRPTQARPVGLPERLIKGVKRRPSLTALIAVSLAALITLLAGWWSFTVELSKEKQVAEARKVQAEVNESEARRNENEAKRARQEVEVTLIDTYGRLIGPRKGIPDLFELEALGELASLTNERVPRGYLEKALQSNDWAERLSRRLDMVAVACVRLSPEKRAKTLHLLEKTLQEDKPDLKIQEVCLRLSLVLEARDPVVLQQAAPMIVHFLSRQEAFGDPDALGSCVATVLNTMPDEQASQLAGKAAQILWRKRDNVREPDLIRTQSAIRKPILQKLQTADARAMAHTLVAQMGKYARYPDLLETLAEELEVVCDKLPRTEVKEQASQAAAILLARFGETESWEYFQHLARGFTTLAGSLPALEASRGAATAARRLAVVLGKKAHPETYRFLLATFPLVVRHLDRGDAQNVTQRILDDIPGSPSGLAVRSLVEALLIVAGKLEPVEINRLANQTAQLLLVKIGNAGDTPDLGELSEGLKLLADRLEPATAATLAQVMTARMNTITSEQNIASLAGGLSAVLKKVEAKQATPLALQTAEGILVRLQNQPSFFLSSGLSKLLEFLPEASSRPLAGAAAQSLLAQMGGVPLATTRSTLARGLADVLDRMKPEDASPCCAAAAEILLTHLKQTNNPSDINALGYGLEALGRHFRPAQAKDAARLVVAVMHKVPEAYNVRILARVLKVVGDKLEHGEACQLRNQAALIILERIERSTNDSHLPHLAGAFAIVAGSLDNQQSNALAVPLMARLGSGESVPVQRHTAEALKALANKLEGAPATDLAHLVMTRLARPVPAWRGALFSTDGKRILVASPELLDTLKVVLPRLDKQALVELLKNPTCVGLVQQLVLEELGRQTGQRLASLWQFVEWAQVHEPNLDLHSPLRWPGPGKNR